jgi:hypothetical protein
MGGEHRYLTSFVEREDVIRLRLHARDFHARGADRHARHTDADHCRSFFEKTLHIRSWNVTLDDVAADDGCVTGSRLTRHTVLRFDRIHVLDVGDGG